MAHVTDRWTVTRNGKKVRTDRYGRGLRWQATWLDERGDERTKSFELKVDAEAHLATLKADQLRGTYIDPRLARVTFREFAESWRATAVHRPATRERVERTLVKHVFPVLGDRQLGAIRTSHMQNWVSVAAETLAPSTLKVAYSVVVTIFGAAVADRVIATSPCAGVRLPEVRRRKVAPPPLEVLATLAAALPPRLQAVVPLVAGAGLRQGEVFGLEVGQVDFLGRRQLVVAQQLVTLPGAPPFIGPPKTPESERSVPLAQVTLDALAAHLAAFPAADNEVVDRTDPRKPATRTARLLFTREDGQPVARHDWAGIWTPAARASGLPPRTGLHVLRHLYASLLIRHGESVKTVQARMGHSSASITLDVYGHLWPDADDRTREAVELALRPDAATDQARTSGELR